MNVPPWLTAPGRRASKMAITSARPPNAASGYPPPMILPSVVRSGRTPIAFLRATGGDPERDDLVEDQQRPVAVGQRAQERQEVRLGRADAAGTLDGFDDDRGELVLPAPQGGFDAVRIAPRQLDDEAVQRGRARPRSRS